MSHNLTQPEEIDHILMAMVGHDPEEIDHILMAMAGHNTEVDTPIPDGAQFNRNHSRC